MPRAMYRRQDVRRFRFVPPFLKSRQVKANLENLLHRSPLAEAFTHQDLLNLEEFT